jgi:acyl-CoA dehydrogenase
MTLGIPRTVYSSEHELFRDTVRQFLVTEVIPHYADWEDQGMTPPEIWRRAGEVGLLGTSIPEAYGGAEAGFLYDSIVIEELGRAGLAAPAWDMHAHIVAPFIVAFGSEAQKKRWLPKMAAGEAIASIGLTEPNGGSDLQNIRTMARRDGDHYVINGSKVFITNGIIGDLILLGAQTSPGEGSRGISLFLVDTTTPGYKKGRNLKKIGNKAQDTAELFFEDMRVPADCMLGSEDAGWRILMHGLAQERLVVAVRSMVICETAIEQTVEYTKNRKAFGQYVFNFQNTQFKLAEAATATAASRPFVDKCIELHARGELSAETAAMAKLWTTELQDQILDDCLQLFGGNGYMWEYPIARAWVDARVHRIYAGTNEIMKYIIGRAL